MSLAKREDVQHLRAFAVMAVVIFHMNSHFLPNGYLGVDLFFVISGFVVWPLILACISNSGQILWKQLKYFLHRRIYRLLPAFGVTLAIFTIATFLVGMIEDHRHIAAQGISAVLMLANLEAYSQSQGTYFHPNPNPLLHTWSLSAEEQVYLIAVISVIIFSLITKKKSKSLIGFAGAISILSCFVAVKLQILTAGAIFYSPLFRIWEFSLGAMAAISNRPLLSKTIVSKFFLGISLISVFNPFEIGIYGQIIGTVSLTIYLSNTEYIIKFIKIREVLTWIGDRSYSIYLWHLPLIYLISRTYLARLIPTIIEQVILISILFVISNLMYKHIEIPYRERGLKNRDRKATIYALLVFALLPLLLLGGLRMGSVNYYWKFAPPVIQGTIECIQKGNYGECESGNIQSKKIYVLVGDSHAAAVSKAFTEAANLLQVKSVIFSGRGCQILGKSNNQRIYPDGSCQKYTSNIVHYLRANKVQSVFVMQRSSSIQNQKSSDDYLFEILEGLIAIKRQTPHLIMLGPTPEYVEGFSQGSLLNLIKKSGWDSRSNLLQNSFSDSNFYSRNLSKYGIEFIETTNLYCSKIKCQFLDKKGYLYWDNNHLSLKGADRLKHVFVESIAKKAFE